jgi:hypothetical protein
MSNVIYVTLCLQELLMLRYRIVFYPMLNQTLASVATTTDDDFGERVDQRVYPLKTFGEDAWPVAHLLRELADRLDADQF